MRGVLFEIMKPEIDKLTNDARAEGERRGELRSRQEMRDRLISEEGWTPQRADSFVAALA